MSKILINSISVFFLFSVSAFASDEKDAICPISGEVIKNTTTKTEFKKGSVYFCTESCKLDFTKNVKKRQLAQSRAFSSFACLVFIFMIPIV